MRHRVEYASDPTAATVRIAAPRHWPTLISLTCLTLMAGALGLALGAAGIGCVASLDRDGVVTGLILLTVSAGIFLAIDRGLRFELAWELFGHELVRVTDQEISIERVSRGRNPIPMGSQRLEDVTGVIAGQCHQWQPLSKALPLRGRPFAWLTVVAHAAEDLRFGLSLGNDEAQQVANFLLNEIEARSKRTPTAAGSGSRPE